MTPPDLLAKYLQAFGHLNRNQRNAPHKPILLLSILDEIERGHIADNEIFLSVELVATFREYWNALPLPPGSWKERIWVPFRHLLKEGFWELVKDGEALTGKEIGDPHSVNDMRSRANFARFVPELWQLLQDKIARDALRVHLLQTCFNILPGQIQPFVPADPLAAQLDKLISEAKSLPKPKTVKEDKGDTYYYVRHNLFSGVIYSLYDNACAVCSLNVRTDARLVVEAAHIKDFATYHDDHPTNGIAFCRNHHWIFDGGGFSIADDYTLLVSPKLQNVGQFVKTGDALRPPSSENCKPAPESLKWHREHKFLK